VVNYVVDAAHFQTDATAFTATPNATNFNSKLRIATGEASTLTFVANVVERRACRIPSDSTRAQLAADPRQAGTGAVRFNTRKSLEQEQLGAVYDGKLSANDDCRPCSTRASRHDSVPGHPPGDAAECTSVSGAASSIWIGRIGAWMRT